MQSSSVPPRVPVPFADGGARNSIPAASQIGVTPGAASLTDGFPPLTRTPKSAGGVPPTGEDMNGILWLTSAWARWSGAGGPVVYDSAFSTAIGGYPKGAVIASPTLGRLWLSLADNNTSNPDTGGANWQNMSAMLAAGIPTSIGTTQTITAPLWANRAALQCWGPGGSGGGAFGSAGAGSAGGGGEYREGVVAVTPGASYLCTVGAAGAAGTGAPTNGSPGTATSFGALMTANAGTPGAAGNNGVQSTGGPGGTSGAGGTGFSGTSGGTAFVAGSAISQAVGGGTVGTSNTSPGTAVNGVAGVFPGGGGNGGIAGGSGGLGANGLIKVVWLP
jgi:hypothetical protein